MSKANCEVPLPTRLPLPPLAQGTTTACTTEKSGTTQELLSSVVSQRVRHLLLVTGNLSNANITHTDTDIHIHTYCRQYTCMYLKLVFMLLFVFTHRRERLMCALQRQRTFVCSPGKKKESICLGRGNGLSLNILHKTKKVSIWCWCWCESALKVSAIMLFWLKPAQWNTAFNLSEICMYFSAHYCHKASLLCGSGNRQVLNKDDYFCFRFHLYLSFKEIFFLFFPWLSHLQYCKFPDNKNPLNPNSGVM